MRRKIQGLLALTLFLALFVQQVTPAKAAAQPEPSKEDFEIEYLDNGDYIVTSISDEPSLSLKSGISLLSEPTTVTKSKTVKRYNSSNDVLWYLKVTGTFTYGHGYAQCTKSVATAKSYKNLWKLTGKKASKAGNVASAYVTANLYMTFLSTKPVRIIKQTVTLECSTTGKFK